MQKAVQCFCIAILVEYTRKRYRPLFDAGIIFLILILLNNTVLSSLEEQRILGGKTQLAIYNWRETYLVNYQLFFLYVAVHLNVFTLIRYKKPIKLRYIFLLSLLLFPLDQLGKNLINFFGLFNAFLFFTIFKRKVTTWTYYEKSLMELYLIYTSMILAGFLVGDDFWPYFHSSYAYSVLLFICIAILSAPREWFSLNSKKRRWKLILTLIPIMLVLGIKVEFMIYLEEYIVLIFMLLYFALTSKRISMSEFKDQL